MARNSQVSGMVEITIDEATKLVIEGKEYSGTVTVDPDTAKQLLDTGRASVVVATIEETENATSGNA